MTDPATDLRQENYNEFIDTIPADVRQLTGNILKYFRDYPVKFNYMFAEGTVYIYLVDDEFKTIIDIVDYLGGDTDSPPFKPYKNNDQDDIFGDYNFYLKLNQEILDASGYLSLPEDDIADIDLEPVTVVEPETAESDELPVVAPETAEPDELPVVAPHHSNVITPTPADQKEVVDFEEPTEELDSNIPGVEEYVEEVVFDDDSYLDEPEEVTATATVSGDDELYWDNLKLIAKGVDNEVLELMRRVHSSTGIIVPITVVRIGSKLLIRTNGDQDSFDQYFMSIKDEAEIIFEGASEVIGTKNNVQVVF